LEEDAMPCGFTVDELDEMRAERAAQIKAELTAVLGREATDSEVDAERTRRGRAIREEIRRNGAAVLPIRKLQ
jgi:hypothetical protein